MTTAPTSDVQARAAPTWTGASVGYDTPHKDDTLPAMPRVLVVCAHPDDESFGLGAILATLADTGSRVSVLCFTHGAASTLHGVAGELAAIRADDSRPPAASSASPTSSSSTTPTAT